MNTIYWHDYETFGANPRRDRASQFAGIRTDEELNIIGDPLMMYCRPADDFLPDPGACLVTGIAPQEALEKGLPELEFCQRIHHEFIQPGTCVAGYNSIRFDDEVTRHLFYRCFYDAYEREWKHGNSRWDIIDMLRMCHAIRPKGINWPQREDGLVSFRLESLTKQNNIGHESAHDALSDVIATIEIAKLVKQQQPRLYDYLYQRRTKKTLAPLLDVEKREPVVHISGMFGAEKGCMAVVIPLLQDPVNPNGVVVYDLSVDPSTWVNFSVEEIRERLYTPKAEMAVGQERIALKTIHINKCPALAPLSVLDDETLSRWHIDLKQCREHLEFLEGVKGLNDKLESLFSQQRHQEPSQAPADADFMLYDGPFFGHHDKKLMTEIHQSAPTKLADFHSLFNDDRLPDLLFRLRARNWPDTLDEREQKDWKAFCRQRLTDAPAGLLGWEEFWQSLAEARLERPDKLALLGQVADYARTLGDSHGLQEPVSQEAPNPQLNSGSD